MIQRIFTSTILRNPNWKERTYAECCFFLTGCLSMDKDFLGKSDTFTFDSDMSNFILWMRAINFCLKIKTSWASMIQLVSSATKFQLVLSVCSIYFCLSHITKNMTSKISSLNMRFQRNKLRWYKTSTHKQKQWRCKQTKHIFVWMASIVCVCNLLGGIMNAQHNLLGTTCMYIDTCERNMPTHQVSTRSIISWQGFYVLKRHMGLRGTPWCRALD